MDERLAELTRNSLRGVARHNPAADLTVYPDNGHIPDPAGILEECRALETQRPKEKRILKRREKRRGPT